MSLPDSTAAAALSEPIIKPVFYAWLDILGDPVRTNTSGANVTPAGTGDPELDGHEFIGIAGHLVKVSPVSYADGGSKSVTASLSGIPGIDDATIALLDDTANWQGREARLWRVIRNAANVQQGGYHNYYTGRMVALKHSGSAKEQVLEITIEGYLAAFSEASNSTYLNQGDYDPGDQSARAAIAIANGDFGGAAATTGGGSSRGGWRGVVDRVRAMEQSR